MKAWSESVIYKAISRGVIDIKLLTSAPTIMGLRWANTLARANQLFTFFGPHQKWIEDRGCRALNYTLHNSMITHPSACNM